MQERLKSLWLALRRLSKKQSEKCVVKMGLINSDCVYCRHYYDKKCSGRYSPDITCQSFERLRG